MGGGSSLLWSRVSKSVLDFLSPLAGTAVAFFAATIGRSSHHHSLATIPAPDALPSSDLYDACLEMNWDRAAELCAESPLDAQFQEGDTMETPLHAACQNQPPIALIRALLEAWPKAVLTKSRLSLLPIHVACHDKACVQVICALVERYPATAMQRNRWGATPLDSLWRDCPDMRKVSTVSAAVEFMRKSGLPFSPYASETTHVLLRAVAKHRQQQQCNGRIVSNDAELHVLHAAVSLGSKGLPFVPFYQTALRYKHQTDVRSSDGRIPLHIAVGPAIAANSAMSSSSSSLGEWWAAKLLLDFHPGSATTLDPNEPPDRYPLHTALLSGRTWHEGIKELATRAPHVLRMRDPELGLFPFQVAAATATTTTGRRINNRCHHGDVLLYPALDSSYELLRCDPTILKQLKT